jgi:MFS family permease
MTAAKPATRARRGHTTTRRRRILVLVCTSFFVAVADSTIVYTALPSIGEGLLPSDDALRWVVISYLLASGALLLLGGRAADRFGRRRVFLTGMGLFTGMSLLCGLAWTGEVLTDPPRSTAT